MDRRDFIKASALTAATPLLLPHHAFAQVTPTKRISIRLQAHESIKTRLAVRELCSGLHLLNGSWDVAETQDDERNGARLTLAIEKSAFKGAEDYAISSVNNGAVLRAGNEQALLYAVFDFLERQGTVFGIDGTSTPIDSPRGLRLPLEAEPWSASPMFATRGLL